MGKFFLKGFACFLFFCCFVSGEPKKVVFSTVSTTPDKDKYTYAPLIEYLDSALPKYRFTFIVVGSVEEMIAKIQKKEVDFYLDSALTSVVVNHHSNSRMLLKRWKNGVSTTNSVFFVNEDSPIKNLKDLKGKTVAFSSSHSTTGYMLPRAELERSGLKLVALEADEKPNGTGYIFSNFSPSSITWVKKKHVDAGALSEEQFNEFSATQDGVRVIHKTSVNLPSHIISVGAHVQSDIVNGVQEVLMGMPQDIEGRKVLDSFEGTKLIEKVTAEDQKNMDHFKQQMAHWK